MPLLGRGEDAVDLAVGGVHGFLDFGEFLIPRDGGVVMDGLELGVGGIEDGLDLGLLVGSEAKLCGEMLEHVAVGAGAGGGVGGIGSVGAVRGIWAVAVAETPGAGAGFGFLDHLGEFGLLIGGEQGADLGGGGLDQGLAGGHGLVVDGFHLGLGGLEDGGDLSLLAAGKGQGGGQVLEYAAALAALAALAAFAAFAVAVASPWTGAAGGAGGGRGRGGGGDVGRGGLSLRGGAEHEDGGAGKKVDDRGSFHFFVLGLRFEPATNKRGAASGGSDSGGEEKVTGRGNCQLPKSDC